MRHERERLKDAAVPPPGSGRTAQGAAALVPLRSLLVEDSDDDARLILRHLRRDGFDVSHQRVETADALEEALDREPWDVVIADYRMPEFDGMAALAQVRARGGELPFIIVSGSIGEDLAVAAMKAGANDYVMKGSLARLGSAITRERAEAMMRRERRIMEQRLQHDALYDSLTGLPNRGLFMDRIGTAVARAAREEGYTFGVLAVGLDGFDVVIGSLGHSASDRLVVAIADTLDGAVKPGDTIARIATDQFAILLDEIPTIATPVQVAERITERLARPFTLDEHEVFVTASLGIVLSGGDESAEGLLRNANIAMNRARSAGKGRREVFDKGMHAGAVEILRLQAELRRALKQGELRNHYQPVFALATGKLVGFEALIRWQHPQRGLLLPDDFVAAAEDNGLIVPMGAWAVGEACRQVAAWSAKHGRDAAVPVSVNVSAAQIRQGDIVKEVVSALRESGIEPALLNLEITETVLMGDPETSRATLLALKALGVRLHCDDFGTGYSSLSYLHRFPLDALKIDRSFVRRLGHDDESERIVRTIALLARDLKLEVIAEGIETAEQCALLASLGCQRGQGFLFSPAVGSDDAGQMLASPPAW